ncbi:MAG: DUF882 domain-containing protein [Synergistaceae bacterium]|nr:DUF882 domain-containing protein [Synergistaceae bacterium]
MANDTKNFKVSEFTCKCGCGHNPIDQRVIDMAQTIRDALGVPVRVNSGCRCEKHNAKSGGVKGSKHITGKAADLSCSLGAVKMFETVKKLQAEGKLPDLDYCIRYKTFIHIDCGGKRKSLWEVRA